jgi:hypothetical protein
MGNILPTMISAVKADATVNTVSGGRVFADYIPENSDKPAAILYTTFEEPFDCLDSFTPMSIATVRFESYGDTREQADDLASAIEDALNGYRGKLSGDAIFVNGVKRQTGKIHLVDIPNDGTDNWQFRSVQSFDISYTTS